MYAIILLALFIIVVSIFIKKSSRAAFAISLPALAFISLTSGMIKGNLIQSDSMVHDFISRFASKGMTSIMIMISDFGSVYTLIIITVVILICTHKYKINSRYWAVIALNLFASQLLNELLKFLFHRPRPEIIHMVKVTGYSFPSGHSMVGMSFYGFLAYIILTRISGFKRYFITILLCLLILIIGISRVYLGVHYTSDVLAGLSGGLVWLAVFIILAEKKNLLKSGK